MTRYINKPTVNTELNAIKWTEDNVKEIFDFIGIDNLSLFERGGIGRLEIFLENPSLVDYDPQIATLFRGEYIVKIEEGKFDVISRELFESLYIEHE